MKQLFVLFAFALITISACTDPITIGGDILGDDRAQVDQLDDFPFTTRVVEEEELLVYRAETGAPLGLFSFGESSDDVFGHWRHSVSITPDLRRSGGQRDTVIVPGFVTDPDVDVDSIVIILGIDTIEGFFGSPRTFPVRMLELAGPGPSGSDQFADAPRPATGANLLSGENFTATAEATLVFDTIYDTRGRQNLAPHIRLKFAQSFVDRINGLTESDFLNDTIFRQSFQGVYIEPMDGTNGFVTLAAQPRQTQQIDYSGIYYFFPNPNSTTRANLYRAPFKDWFVRYDHDLSGSLSETLLEDGEHNNIMIAGGTGSVMTEIEFPDIATLRNTLINQAEFTFTLRNLDGYDYTNVPAAKFLALFYRNTNGNLVNILDIGDSGSNGINSPFVRQFLGGFLEMDGSNIIYRNRLPRHLQGIVDADFSDPKLYLRVISDPRNPFPFITNSIDPSRVILFGPDASENAASLDVVFTRVE